jgi:hypothetical protein
MTDQDTTELAVSMAVESDTVQANFAEAVQETAPVTVDDAQVALDHARESAAHEATAQAAHDQQTSYLEHGDIAHAQEMNVTVLHEYAAADVAGTPTEHQFVQAQQEGTSLAGAAWHESDASQHAQDAQIALQSGDLGHAAQYATMAETSASSAADYASHGDQDHSYGTHADSSSYDVSHDASYTSSYDSSHSDTPASTDTSSHVDTSGSDASA